MKEREIVRETEREREKPRLANATATAAAATDDDLQLDKPQTIACATADTLGLEEGICSARVNSIYIFKIFKYLWENKYCLNVL